MIMADEKNKSREKDAKEKNKPTWASAAVKKEKKPVIAPPLAKIEKKPSRFSRLVGGKKKVKTEEKEKAVALTRDPYDVLKFVLMTEKSVRMIELQNKLVFVVDRGADKDEIRAAAGAAFNSPIRDVRTVIDQSGRKKAFIRFEQEGAAGEIAIRLGII
jgi:large subunit ribosomal protein L23